MKKVILTVLLMAFAVVAFAQTSNSSYKKGYKADVELGTKIYSGKGKGCYMVTTSHGYSFGNGLYVGGGLGIGVETFGMLYNADARICVPIFADVKYSFMNRLVSPFVSLKTGGYYDYTQCGIGYFVRPAIGVDIWRFSLNVGADYMRSGYASTVVREDSLPYYQTAILGNTGVYVGLSFSF